MKCLFYWKGKIIYIQTAYVKQKKGGKWEENTEKKTLQFDTPPLNKKTTTTEQKKSEEEEKPQ